MPEKRATCPRHSRPRSTDAGLRATDLMVEHARHPLGIGRARPRFGWKLSSSLRNQTQSAFRILVATSLGALDADRADLWDSGEVVTGSQIGILYSGHLLGSRTRCYWKVRVRDAAGRAGPWSAPAWFETGLLYATDWSARWITHTGFPGLGPADGAAQLRTGFILADRPARARVYATALGLYELEINGAPVGNARLAPGWTDYCRRIQYQAYEVTRLLHAGENAIGARLAPGWYAGRVATYGRGLYGERPALLIQLEAAFASGDAVRVVSDESWRTTDGPIVAADLLDGEVYDARRETPGWSRPEFDDSGWTPALSHDGASGALVAQADPPVRVIRELSPVRTGPLAGQVHVFDMGQNMAGTVRLTVRGGRPGSQLILRFGEMLNQDGTLYTANLRSARATDRYVLKGSEEEAYEPRFTVHGFRYVEVTADDPAITVAAIVGRVLSTSAPVTGRFVTSSTALNRLQSNITRSQRANSISVPTDCAQRDERMGWTGDVSVFGPTAVFNADCSRFLGVKWLADVRDAQLPDGAIPDVAPYVPGTRAGNAGWGDAVITVPFVLWQAYGDTAVIEENYDAMTRWIAYLTAHSVNGLRPAAGWGDWHILGEQTPLDLVATACYARSAALIAQMATVVGRDDDARRYQQLAGEVRAAFIHAYVGRDGSVRGDTQAAYVLALSSGLVPEQLRGQAVSRLLHAVEQAGWRPSTGMLTTSELLTVLSDHGHADAAYRLLTQLDCPSWLYPVTQGATTIWEHWDSVRPDGSLRDPAMNSFNHYAYGAVGSWMYRNIAGINTDPGRPGFRHVILRPRPGGGLTWASGTFRSVYGTVRSSWRLRGGALMVSVRIPPGTTATACVPAAASSRVTVRGRDAADADGARYLSRSEGCAVFEIGSGAYRFTAERPVSACR